MAAEAHPLNWVHTGLCLPSLLRMGEGGSSLGLGPQPQPPTLLPGERTPKRQKKTKKAKQEYVFSIEKGKKSNMEGKKKDKKPEVGRLRQRWPGLGRSARAQVGLGRTRVGPNHPGPC